MQGYYNRLQTPLGDLYCLIENEKIIYLSPNPIKPHPLINANIHPLFKECKAQMDAYFSRELQSFSLPFDLKKTPFTQKVLRFLLEIPFGETRSYAQLAHSIGHPKAHRAIGSALSKNPLLLILPCHRIIRSNQTIGQYLWGKEKKEWLLSFEGAV